MLIKQVCKKCDLTKKAVEYYEKQGLVSPHIDASGYRIFTDNDVLLLQEISLLRKLNINIADIKTIINSKNKKEALSDYKIKMGLQIHQMEAQYDCLNYLLDHQFDAPETSDYIKHKLDKDVIIKDKLLQAFPGNYGKFLCLHFGKFLGETIDSNEKAVAYGRIIEFLDSIGSFEFPKEIEELLNDSFEKLSEADLKKMDESIYESINNYESYLEQNHEALEQYLIYLKSDEFKNSLAFKMRQLLMDFQKSSGYNDIFISNLKILSSSYKEYTDKMQIANEKFLTLFPQVKDLYK